MSKKPENKDELNIQGLKKHFIESTLDAEFDEHMGYQKYDQNSRDVSNNYRKRKTKKTISTDNRKNWYSSSKRTTINIWTKDC